MQLSVEEFRKIYERYQPKHDKYVKECKIAERYYRHDNDINYDTSPANRNKNKESNPLRAADNRIPHDYHAQLVNQKASYLFSFPPLFDTGNDKLNESIKEQLGDDYEKYCNTLCTDASNFKSAWLHVWKDEQNKLKYAPVPPVQIIPIYSSSLIKELTAVIRIYTKTFVEAGKDEVYTIYEYWDKDGCTAFMKKEQSTALGDIFAYDNHFTTHNIETGSITDSNYMKHDFECVPFIEFPNNNIKDSDLTKIKPFIDVMDCILSGYCNDIDDIQQIIWVLTNYGGTDLDEFKGNLKKYKAISIENGGNDDRSGIQTISIDIPVEARNKLIDICRKQIYEQGQGLDPHPEGGFGNASGEALKFMYAPLELKAGLMEVEFKSAFNKLIRIIAAYLGHKEYFPITQTWTRNMIKNDLELSQIAQASINIISRKTIYKNHPWVEDADQEEKQVEEENNLETKYKGLLTGDDE